MLFTIVIDIRGIILNITIIETKNAELMSQGSKCSTAIKYYYVKYSLSDKFTYAETETTVRFEN